MVDCSWWLRRVWYQPACWSSTMAMVPRVSLQRSSLLLTLSVWLPPAEPVATVRALLSPMLGMVPTQPARNRLETSAKVCFIKIFTLQIKSKV